MIDDDSGGEDEWRSVQRRFSKEGLDWCDVDEGHRTIYIWRWLVDAESNLKAVRHINDKLRRQHHQEKEELEEYSKHLREKSEDRVHTVEGELKKVKCDLEAMLSAAGSVATMMDKEGLTDLSHAPLQEQIAYLLVERTRLTEELDAARTKPASNREKDLTTELIKSATDLELLKRTHNDSQVRLSEMSERVTLLEKASNQLELDNETLAYKLSEALAEIEETEGQLRRYSGLRRGESPRTSLRSLDEGSLGSGAFRRDSTRGSGRKKGEAKRAEPMRVERKMSQGKHSKSNSDDIKKLQGELTEIRKDLLVAEDKFEYGIRKYEVYKIKSKSRLTALKSTHKSELESLKRTIDKLESDLSVKISEFDALQKLHKELQTDLKSLRTDKHNLSSRLREIEKCMVDKEQELNLLKEKCKLMETAKQ